MSVRYDREVLTNVLVYHQRTSIRGCRCGWAVLGASHPEHVADIYEEAMKAQRVAGYQRDLSDVPIDQQVTCSYPGCVNQLRKADRGGLQFCSLEHRDLFETGDEG